MVNIAQSYLILHFSIKCMSPLIVRKTNALGILGFPRLNWSLSWLAVVISYCRFYSVNISLFLG